MFHCQHVVTPFGRSFFPEYTFIVMAIYVLSNMRLTNEWMSESGSYSKVLERYSGICFRSPTDRVFLGWKTQFHFYSRRKYAVRRDKPLA